MAKVDVAQLNKEDSFEYVKTSRIINDLSTDLSKVSDMSTASEVEQYNIRKDLIILTKSSKKLMESDGLNLSENDKKKYQSELKKVKSLTDYAPSWVILMIALALGLGTMVGWKRIVQTIGEKIGKEHLTYAQGASSELVAAATISASTALGLPVSTTQVLSSGIAGSMVASKGIKNLQKKTIRNIFIAWVLTLPVCILMSGWIVLVIALDTLITPSTLYAPAFLF
jgi:phosphate/sulfate permease